MHSETSLTHTNTRTHTHTHTHLLIPTQTDQPLPKHTPAHTPDSHKTSEKRLPGSRSIEERSCLHDHCRQIENCVHQNVSCTVFKLQISSIDEPSKHKLAHHAHNTPELRSFLQTQLPWFFEGTRPYRTTEFLRIHHFSNYFPNLSVLIDVLMCSTPCEMGSRCKINAGNRDYTLRSN